MDKKGAEMTIGTIVMIILALVVLVVIIYGFTVGWGNLWQNILGFGGGEVNVQTIVQSCKVDCAVSNEYNYCTKTREVVFDKDRKETMTCDKLSKEPGTGLECDRITCAIQKYACSDLEAQCGDVEKCVVTYMSQNAFDRRQRGEYIKEQDDHEYIGGSLVNLNNFVTTEDLAANLDRICTKALYK